MKLLAIVAFLLFSQAIFANACNEVCSTTSDCTDAACNICVGFCVSCYALGDSASCADAGTGASTNCQWDGRNCKHITDVPEMSSHAFKFFIFLIPLVFLIPNLRRRFKNC